MSGKKIIFIEDESALQRTFSDVLGREGYNVISALDGEIGWRLIKREKPDLILLDLILPRMNGFEVLDKLNADEETKGTPVIVLTNLEKTEDVKKALERGATTYLIKANYTLKDVVDKVKRVLGE